MTPLDILGFYVTMFTVGAVVGLVIALVAPHVRFIRK